MMIGEPVRVFWSEVMELAEQTRQFKLHFASARETFNMIAAGLQNQTGDPGSYRDYALVPVMDNDSHSAADLSNHIGVELIEEVKAD